MVFLVVLIALIDTVRCDYECLCSYNVEKPVFSTPYVSGQKIGYMYEFDCKPTLKKVGVSDKMWTSIAFEHKVGFVESDPQIEVVTCPGDPASSDIVTTTIPTTAPLLLSSTIILSNSTISTIATLSTVTSSEASTTTSSTPFQTNSTTYNTVFHTYKTPLSLNITALVNSSSSSTPLVTSSTVLETTTIPLSRSTTNTYTNNTERKTPNTTPSTTIHMASTVTHDLDRSTTLSHISRTTGNIFISSTTRMTSQPKHSSTETTSVIRNHSLTTDKATTSLQISTKRAIGTTNQNNITSTIPSSIGTIFSSPSTIHSSTQKSVIPSTTISPTLTALPHCPYHWTLHAGSCYLFHTDDRRIWTDAEDLCLRHNSHLVYIESKAENTYIVEHLKGLIKGHDLNHDSSSATWIGGSDELLEKTWVWYGIDQPITYSDWGFGEPDSGDGHHEEDCISIVGRRNWHWHDFSCGKQMYFICERPSYYTSSPLYVG